MSRKDFKKLSLEFRRVSGNLLNCDDDVEAMRLLRIFLKHIDDEAVIADFIEKCIVKDINIEDEIKKSEMQNYEIPIEKDEEVSFIYNLLRYGANNNIGYRQLSWGYGRDYKISTSIRAFNNQVVRRLVNHITDYLEGWAIDMGYDENPNAKIQITGNVGQLNFSQEGNVNAVQNNNDGAQSIREIAEQLIKLINNDKNIPNVEKEEVIDYIETSVDQLEGDKPKRSILKITQEKVESVKNIAANSAEIATKGKALVDFFKDYL